MSKKCVSKIVVAALAITAAFSASAAPTSTTFSVSANVASQCSIAANPLSFGTYDPLATADNTATTTLSVNCSNMQPVTIALSAGTSPGATETTRSMVLAGKPSMNYALYSDANRTSNWGTTAGAVAATGLGLNTPVTLTVYGSIPKNQYAVAVGGYADSVTATVTY